MSNVPTYMCLCTGYHNGYPVQCIFQKGHLGLCSWNTDLLPKLPPTITLTEADARVAAFRQLAAETAERTADYDYSTSPACRCKQAILALSASDAALEQVKRERDNLWIEAFHAEDLEPRVTPESLADWVFRDVKQQLDGLKREEAALKVVTAQAKLAEVEVERTHEDRMWRLAELEAELAAAKRNLAEGKS